MGHVIDQVDPLGWPLSEVLLDDLVNHEGTKAHLNAAIMGPYFRNSSITGMVTSGLITGRERVIWPSLLRCTSAAASNSR